MSDFFVDLFCQHSVLYIYIYTYTSIKALFLGGGKSKKGINAKRRTYFLRSPMQNKQSCTELSLHGVRRGIRRNRTYKLKCVLTY